MQQVYVTQQNIVDRLFGWWYVIAAPRPVSDDAPLLMREYMRRGKFTSIILLIALIENICTLGVGSQVILPVLINIITLTVCVFLNRAEKVRTAGAVALIVIELSMCLGLLTQAPVGALSAFSLSSFIILVQPDLIAVSLFPAVVALPLGLFNLVVTLLGILLLPKSPEVAHYLVTSRFDAFFTPLSVQLVVTLVSFFWVSNASLEMKRADRAEEVNKLTQALAEQQRTALQEKQRLEESIQQIVSVHMQVANGNFNARVPLDQKNVLWSIAGSLNNLLARLQRWRFEAQQMQRVEHALQQTLQDVRLAKKEGVQFQPRKTGTPLDTLIFEMAAVSTRPLTSSTSYPQFQSAEDIDVSHLPLPPLTPQQRSHTMGMSSRDDA